MKIETLKSKCFYCGQQLASKYEDNHHNKCKNEVDQFQSIYGIKNPWIQLWINLLVNNLNLDFNLLNFKYLFSIQDLYVELKEFTNYELSSGLIFENLCFIKFNSPTWICLKGDTAIDANNYQEWSENEFYRMIRNYLYNPTEILRQYTSSPLIQLYFPAL